MRIMESRESLGRDSDRRRNSCTPALIRFLVQLLSRGGLHPEMDLCLCRGSWHAIEHFEQALRDRTSYLHAIKCQDGQLCPARKLAVANAHHKRRGRQVAQRLAYGEGGQGIGAEDGIRQRCLLDLHTYPVVRGG